LRLCAESNPPVPTSKGKPPSGVAFLVIGTSGNALWFMRKGEGIYRYFLQILLDLKFINRYILVQSGGFAAF